LTLEGVEGIYKEAYLKDIFGSHLLINGGQRSDKETATERRRSGNIDFSYMDIHIPCGASVTFPDWRQILAGRAPWSKAAYKNKHYL